MSSSRKPKATKLATAALPGAVAKADVEPGRAANFSDAHVDPATFDRDVCRSDNWIRTGASLIRAARAVMRQVHIDHLPRRNEPGQEPPGNRAQVVQQAIFLAALAVENGLKAVLAEDLQVVARSGVLPTELQGHDLRDLAFRANVGPIGDHEDEALKRGQSYTEWLGRYPSTVAHDEQHTRASIDVGAMFSAYERIFFRCVKEAARRQNVRVPELREKAEAEADAMRVLFEWEADGVDPLPDGAIAPHVEFATYPGFITISSSRE